MFTRRSDDLNELPLLPIDASRIDADDDEESIDGGDSDDSSSDCLLLDGY